MFLQHILQRIVKIKLEEYGLSPSLSLFENTFPHRARSPCDDGTRPT